MRDQPTNTGHRTRVADSRTTAKPQDPSNFEYDDNEWDIGIGDLIIDLDADIEKTNEGEYAINKLLLCRLFTLTNIVANVVANTYGLPIERVFVLTLVCIRMMAHMLARNPCGVSF